MVFVKEIKHCSRIVMSSLYVVFFRQWEMEECLVIGGAGYPGMSLATTIASSGVHVKVFDVMQPSSPLPENITFIQVLLCV